MIVTILTDSNAPAIVEDVTKIISGLNFGTSLPGLFDKATFGLKGNDVDTFIRFLGYLGKRVVVYTDDGEVAWDGLIWSIEANMGGYSLGPRDLGSVWNYVTVEYSDILDSNRYALTDALSDDISQDTYGIKEQVLPYGQMTSSAADKAVQRYLNNHKDPFTSGNLSIPLSGNEIGTRINCVGWWTTTHYRKFQSALTTDVTVQNRIKEIVDRTVLPDNPAGSYYLEFFDTGTTLIEGTDLTIARATLHVETIGSYLQRIVSLGDDDNNTWYIGAEHGEVSGTTLDGIGPPRVKVWQRPTAPEFFVSSQDGKIYGAGGTVIPPAMLRAGSFVQIIDFNPQLLSSDDRLDRISGFILAETNYDADSGILTGKPEGQDIDVDMILARMG